MIPKGKRLENNQYLWTCSHPQGLPCGWCYQLDEKALLESLANSRGEKYYANLKAYLSIKGQAIASQVLEIKDTQGQFTPRDLLLLADQFHFPRNRMKALIQWLEECQIFSSGTYERKQEKSSLETHKTLRLVQRNTLLKLLNGFLIAIK